MSKLVYLSGRSTTSSNACVEVYPLNSHRLDIHVAHVWFPENGLPYVSLNDTNLSDGALIANARLALEVDHTIVL